MLGTPSGGVTGEFVRSERLRRLRAMLARCRHRHRGTDRRFIATGLAGLDGALPHGGLPSGAVTEILCSLDGGGATTLALRAALAAAGRSRWVVVVDTRGDFYPPAAWRMGVNVDRLVVIRRLGLREALWAVDQTLRCSAVAAVVAPVNQLEDAVSRRLQLAAESGDALGLLLRPATGRRHSFAAVQMLVEPLGLISQDDHRPVAADLRVGRLDTPRPTRRSAATDESLKSLFDSARLCRVTLVKVREGRPAEPFVIDLNDETGTGSLLSVPGDRPAGGECQDHRRISA